MRTFQDVWLFTNQFFIVTNVIEIDLYSYLTFYLFVNMNAFLYAYYTLHLIPIKKF